MYQQDYQPQPQLNPQDLLYQYEQPQFNNAPVYATAQASVPAAPISTVPASVPANQSEAAPVNGANFFTQTPRNEAETYAICRRIALSDMCPHSYLPETYLKKILTYEKDEKKARSLALEKAITNIWICLMYGYSLNLNIGPLQMLHGIAVINGKPGLYGDLLLAVCVNKANVRVTETWDDKNKIAFCRSERPGFPTVEKSFGFNNAIYAGYMVQDPKTGYIIGNKAGPWSTNPDRMCLFRARSFALRDQCADVLFGLGSAEELADIPTENDESSEQAEVPEKRRRRTKAEMIASQIQIQKEIQQKNTEIQQQEQIPPIDQPPVDAHAQEMLNKYGDLQL